jgi:predicted DNA binding protein
MTWCFDTSAFIEPWVRLYPPDIFGPVWDKVEKLAENEEITAPADVLLELEKQKDDLHEWAKPELFETPDREVMEVFTEIVNDHPDFMKINSTKSGADPFVVALAEVKELTVVTYETMAKKNAAPKIPNVCAARGLGETASLVDVLRAGGFKL